MKVGIRTPSIKKSISARTSGNCKRQLKRMTNPFYGKKGMGWIRDPEKALKNKIYRKTTISSAKATKGLLWCCFVLPCLAVWWMIKYFAILLWLFVKYAFLIVWWLIMWPVNGCIWIVEKIIYGRNSNNVE